MRKSIEQFHAAANLYGKDRNGNQRTAKINMVERPAEDLIDPARRAFDGLSIEGELMLTMTVTLESAEEARELINALRIITLALPTKERIAKRNNPQT